MVCEIIHETADAIVTRLKGEYIKFPTRQGQLDVIDAFESKWGFPQRVGALDGSHIPVQPPTQNHTILIQAVVDHAYLSRNVNVGWPGSVHDAWVSANSSLFAAATAKCILQGNNRKVLGCEIPPLLIADSA